MRLFTVGVALLLAVSTTAVAQSRWTFSAGPEWQPYLGGAFIGGRVRGEYDLLKPNKPFRLRMELGGYWEPTHDRFGYSSFDGSSYSETRQSVDLSLGFSAVVSPLPRARFAPYFAVGVLARQTWTRGSYVRFPANGQPTSGAFSGTLGDLVYPVGLGIRARIMDRVLQFEYRRFLGGHRNGLMVGTSLPF
jgi:hypothetical protein